MADAQTVPLWVTIFGSSLTFVGGLLSGQLAEFFRARREKEAKDLARTQALKDKRIEFQRATLLEMQEAALMAVQRLHTILENAQVPVEQRVSLKLMGQVVEKQRQFAWRWTLLTSRVTGGDIRVLADGFKDALNVSYFSLDKPQYLNSLETSTLRFNELNTLIGNALRKLDSDESASI